MATLQSTLFSLKNSEPTNNIVMVLNTDGTTWMGIGTSTPSSAFDIPTLPVRIGTFTYPAGSGSGVAGTGPTFTTGASGGGTAAGGDYTINLGSETGVARAGKLILNRTSLRTDGGSYNGTLTINETLTPTPTVTGSTQALNILYTMNGDAAGYTSSAGNAGIGPIESQFICNLTGTLATLLYGAEFQFIHQGTGSANATVVQADLYGLAASAGTLSAGVCYRGIIGPLNGVTATVINGVDIESGGFATRSSIAANSTLSVRNYYAGCSIGSAGGTDTVGGYAITGYAGVIPTQSGNTTGTNTHLGINISHLFPNSGGGTPGVNGNADNYAAQLGVPNAPGPGSGTGRVHNIALYILGNGAASTQGAGFTNDWAFHSISTAPSGLLGALYIGAPSTNNPPQTSAMLTILGTKTVVSGGAAVLNTLSLTAATITLSGGSNVTTATGFNLATLVAPTYSNASISVLRGATLAITGPPTVTGGMTLTNAYALDVQTGNVFLGGLVTTYNNIAVGGNGVPSEVKVTRPTTQTNTTVTLATYTTPAADGSYEIQANLNVTVSTTVTMTVTCAYTDEANIARTLTLPFFLLAGTLVQSITTAQGNIAYSSMPITIRTKASTSITIATAGTVTAVTYTGEGIIKQLA